ncbi:MAG: ABC transporter permease subunit, partial [Oscillospiraceae bacterium]|jgi:multiple sugar transport system permease protein|nr:ABC transporter permease subunit [Oscillospiraceae bacterium]
MVFTSLWGSLGTSFLIFIAGFQGVDKRYYEAAALDGIKNRWQELYYVTLPMVTPQLLITAVLSITGAFGVSGGMGTDYTLYTIGDMITDYGGTRFEIGYAGAIATFLFLLMMGCNKAVHKLLKGLGK